VEENAGVGSVELRPAQQGRSGPDTENTVYQETCIGNRAGVIDEHIKMEECPCDP
jgi:hypothetical protein